jgi:SnoaL-like protein
MWRGRGGYAALAAAFAFSLSLTAGAQGDAKAVQEAVEAFLSHLGNAEFDKVAQDLASKSTIIVVRNRPSAGPGQPEWSTSHQTGEEWLAVLKRNPNPVRFREPLTNVSVTVDDDHLAHLRADFQVLRDGNPQSHGVDQFTLVRENGVWKIAVVAYTSIPNP